MIKPILTEKSLNQAKTGNYTFLVDVILDKGQIKAQINEIYGVHVRVIRTMNYKGMIKTNIRGRKVTVPARKKAIVTLSKDEKIDAFEVKANKKK